jgi:hypothetical protein
MSPKRALQSVIGLVTATLALAFVPIAAVPAAASTDEPATLVGAFSADWNWFDNAVGPMQIYRIFDTNGFHYATWQDTLAYQRHPNATAFDYSFDVAPQRLTDPIDPINAKIKAFLATTPKNLIITDYHEPDYTFGLFTPAQFRAGILALARMVRAQNDIDGGHRMTSVILMDVTFGGTWSTQPIDWWPTDARDGGHVDLIEGDMYEWPHGTNTPGVPRGYTDGIKWRTATQLLSPLRNFAVAQHTPWAIAELGILEDINDSMHKANELAAAVAYAKAYGALHICYFDNYGSRADWRLRYSSPPGTTSPTSNAAVMWKSLASQSAPPPPPPPPPPPGDTRQWVLNQGFDGGSQTGWTNVYSGATRLATTQLSGNWVLSIGNGNAAAQDVGVCNSPPFWINNATVAGTVYTATAQAVPSTAGIPVRMFMRETTPGGVQVRFVQTPALTLADPATLTPLPSLDLTAVQNGDSIRTCIVAIGLGSTQRVYTDNVSLTSPN